MPAIGFVLSAPGTLSEVLVEDGDAVKEGQLLMRQDCAAEEAQLRKLDLEADSDVRVQYAVKA